MIVYWNKNNSIMIVVEVMEPVNNWFGINMFLCNVFRVMQEHVTCGRHRDNHKKEVLTLLLGSGKLLQMKSGP